MQSLQPSWIPDALGGLALFGAGFAFALWFLRSAAKSAEQDRSGAVYAAASDPLTGLPNRIAVSASAQLALVEAQRSGGQLALLALSVDRLKPINDSLGHEAGDELLLRTVRASAPCCAGTTSSDVWPAMNSSCSRATLRDAGDAEVVIAEVPADAARAR